jgi:hypothetical protein
MAESETDRSDVRGRPRRVTGAELARAWRVVTFGFDLGGLAGGDGPVERWDQVATARAGFAAAPAAGVARPTGLVAELERASGARR